MSLKECITADSDAFTIGRRVRAGGRHGETDVIRLKSALIRRLISCSIVSWLKPPQNAVEPHTNTAGNADQSQVSHGAVLQKYRHIHVD